MSSSSSEYCAAHLTLSHFVCFTLSFSLLTHTLTITCTYCYDEIKGTHDLKIYSHADSRFSLILSLTLSLSLCPLSLSHFVSALLDCCHPWLVFASSPCLSVWCSGGGGVKQGPSAARMGCWKAHWGTAPGMGGCQIGAGVKTNCPTVSYDAEDPLLFNVCIDPSEGIPLSGAKNDASDPGPSPVPVPQAEIELAKSQLVVAYKRELATFERGQLVEPDLLPGLRAALSHFVFFTQFFLLSLSLRPLIVATPGCLLLLAHA